MKNLFYFLALSFLPGAVSGQMYIHLKGYGESTVGLCDAAVDAIPVNGISPYNMAWSNGTWSPSSGLRTENICNGTIITMDILDGACRLINGHIYIDPDPAKQLSLDTIIITMPSAPGMCDGSIEFRINNVWPGCTRHFSTPGSGYLTTDSVFTGLCDNYYGYSIYDPSASVLYEVKVSLHFPGGLGLCEPLIDSIELVTPTTSSSCNGEIHMNTSGATSGSYYHKIYNSSYVQINAGDIYNPVKSGLCPGPYIVESYSTGNNYHTRTTVYIDDPGIADSTWGAPPLDTLASTGVDTILLSALTTCGLDYAVNIDTAFVSGYTALDTNYYNVEVTLVQDTSISHVYCLAYFDTSHVICFDITVFCADSVLVRSGGVYSSRNLIFLKPYINYASVGENTFIENGLNAFPNPFNQNLVVTSKFVMERIEIYAIDGSMILNRLVNDKAFNLDTSALASSIYTVVVFGRSGEKSVLKVIKLEK